jgi:hypothetical protein
MTTRADATRAHPAPLPEEVDEDLDADGLPVDDFDADADALEAEAADSLSEETGIDLTDASELDADNVPADEEFDRVMNAPD